MWTGPESVGGERSICFHFADWLAETSNKGSRIEGKATKKIARALTSARRAGFSSDLACSTRPHRRPSVAADEEAKRLLEKEKGRPSLRVGDHLHCVSLNPARSVSSMVECCFIEGFLDRIQDLPPNN
ncbi:hypothetical protein MUK42_35857 [Musa troglodytarum]|uniref:Uncharacterized protein n=1 Tax=Musa troglodytarum TaxID=320322 RepID=A0A9E7K9S5_9LILI|nr:hypothetical protein MUK42_35857 [Musa troglodytarum]